MRIQVRHDALDELTRLAKMPIWIDRAAKGGSVSVPVYATRPDAAAAKGGGFHRFLPHGSACGFAVGLGVGISTGQISNFTSNALIFFVVE